MGDWQPAQVTVRMLEDFLAKRVRKMERQAYFLSHGTDRQRASARLSFAIDQRLASCYERAVKEIANKIARGEAI